MIIEHEKWIEEKIKDMKGKKVYAAVRTEAYVGTTGFYGVFSSIDTYEKWKSKWYPEDECIEAVECIVDEELPV